MKKKKNALILASALAVLSSTGFGQISHSLDKVRRLQRDIVAVPVRAAERAVRPAAGSVLNSANPMAVVPGDAFERQMAKLEAGKIYVVAPSPENERDFREAMEPQLRQLVGDAPSATVPRIFRVTAKNGNDVQFKPYGYFGDRLAWQQGTGKFRGSILVGIMALDPDAAQGGLSKAMVFQALDGG